MSLGDRKRTRTLDAEQLYEYAIKSLAARAQSTGELREKLRKRAADPADIDVVIARLREHGFLNDRRFAESFTQSRKENRGFGKLRVLSDLRARRVAPKLAEQVASQAYEGEDETVLIGQFLERKFRGVDLPAHLADEKHLAAVYRRLRRAGFSSGASVKVLFRYAKEAERLSELEGEEPSETDGAPAE